MKPAMTMKPATRPAFVAVCLILAIITAGVAVSAYSASHLVASELMGWHSHPFG
jgi:hypothetical protein